MIASGVWPTMVTPFTPEGGIDYPGVESLLSFYAESEVAGVFAVCQSSEMFHLTLAERKALSAFISEHLPDGLQMIVSGHVADDIETQLREAEAIMAPAAQAYVVLPNRFAAPHEGDDLLLERLDRFVSASPGVPLGIYECPYPYKRLLTPKVLQYCMDSGRFLFIKDTCCEMDRILARIAMLRNSDIKLFNANSATLLQSLQAGASGFSGVMANFHPAYYVWLCKHFREQPEKAAQLQNYLGEASLAEYQAYPANAKYCLSLKGLPIRPNTRVRADTPLTESQMLEMKQFESLSSFMAEIIGI